MRRQVFVLFCALLQVAQAKVNYAYVANHSTNTVSVINTANNTVLKTIPVGTTPTLVTVNQAGTFVYVANQGSNNVSVISTSTNSVIATIPVGSAPVGAAFTPNGKTVYVSNSTGRTRFQSLTRVRRPLPRRFLSAVFRREWRSRRTETLCMWPTMPRTRFRLFRL